MALMNCPECKSVLFDIHCQNCGHHVVNKFFLPEGFYFIGDPIAVFTDIEQWVLIENAKLNCVTVDNIYLSHEERKSWYEDLLEKVDLNKLEFWYQIEKKLACCFYAELNGTEIWAAKVFRAIEYENSICGDGYITTNMKKPYEMLITYSGWMSIIPTSIGTKMEFKKEYVKTIFIVPVIGFLLQLIIQSQSLFTNL